MHRAMMIATPLVLALLAGGCITSRAYAPHPAGDGKPPVCTGCHDASMGPLDHNANFGRSHGVAAVGTRDTCLRCHGESSCAVCHVNKAGMSPAELLRDRPGLDAPHRGDWLTRHRVEGKVNPVSCATCHALRNNARCRSCHR